LVKISRIANSAGAGYDAVNRGEGLFYLDGTPAQGHSVAEIEEALRGQIARVVNEGISEQELRRVKSQVTASQVFSQDSVYYQAMRIGMLESVGIPHQTADLQVRRLQEVTAEQVRDVARRYLVDDNLTVAVLDPQALPGGKRPRPKAENSRELQ
jgi:zinc protease